MRTAMRPRYYCDFCKKASGSPSAMRKHEAGCTNRRDRQCGMCYEANLEQASIETLIPLAMAGDVDGLRKAANGCPACMLAAIRLAPWPTLTFDDGPMETVFDIHTAIANWRFKDEKDAFWKVVNGARADDVPGYAF